MASKPVPAKRKPTTATDDSQEASSTKIKTANCSNLSQTGTVGYAISVTNSGTIELSLTSSSGNGYFSKAKVSFDELITSLQKFESSHPLTSLAIKDAYPPHTSVNSWSMTMAVLFAEGLVAPHPLFSRRFKLSDSATVQKWKAAHSQPGKGKPKAKSKAAPLMPKKKPVPATGK